MNARTDIRPMGLVLDLPFEDYAAVDAFNNGAMKELSKSPWHLQNRVKVIASRPMLCGSLAHCAQLEPHALADRYVFVPAGAPRRPTEAQWNAKKSNEDSMAAKEWWSAFGDEVAGRTIITAEEFAIMQAQLAAISANPTLAELFSKGYGEASVFAEIQGVYCKARPDWVHPLDERRVVLVDLKATADESPVGFGRTAARLAYHRQARHYIEVFEQATGLQVVNFVFAAVTSAMPVLAVPYLLTDELNEQAIDECAELRALYAHCRETNTWPTYGDGYQLLDFPAWAKRSGEVEVSFIED